MMVSFLPVFCTLKACVAKSAVVRALLRVPSQREWRADSHRCMDAGQPQQRYFKLSLYCEHRGRLDANLLRSTEGGRMPI